MSSPAGKGRPTPKRSQTQRRRTGPVTPPPQTRKEAAKRAKEQAASSRTRIKQGAARGEERYLAPRDAGPVRALVRDTVDSRRNVGVLLLPLALVLVAAQISRNPQVLDLALTVWMAGLIAMIADLVLITLTIRRRVGAKFPAEPKLGKHVTYGLLRSTVFRRFRLPPTRVSPGRGRPG